MSFVYESICVDASKNRLMHFMQLCSNPHLVLSILARDIPGYSPLALRSIGSSHGTPIARMRRKSLLSPHIFNLKCAAPLAVRSLMSHCFVDFALIHGKEIAT